MNRILKILFPSLRNSQQQYIKRPTFILSSGALSIILCWVVSGAIYAQTSVNGGGKQIGLAQNSPEKRLKNWNDIHAKYANKTYQLKDTWELVDYFNFGNLEDERTRKEIYDMKIRLEGDTLLFQNDRKIKVKRVLQDTKVYQKNKELYGYLVRFFSNQGINIGTQIPVLRLVPVTKGIYSRDLEYIYIGNYLVLYHKGVVLMFKYIKRNGQGLPDATATIMYNPSRCL